MTLVTPDIPEPWRFTRVGLHFGPPAVNAVLGVVAAGGDKTGHLPHFPHLQAALAAPDSSGRGLHPTRIFVMAMLARSALISHDGIFQSNSVW
jgi:hypothetical protein